MKEKRQNKSVQREEKVLTSRTRFGGEKRNPMGTAFDTSASLMPIFENTKSERKKKVLTMDKVKKQAPQAAQEEPEKKPMRGVKTGKNTKTVLEDGKKSSVKTAKGGKTTKKAPVIQEEVEKTAHPKRKRPVKIIFLGGVGEIGKNMTALEYGHDIIIIDAGLTFPNGEDMPGVDSVIPDYAYLVQNKAKIRGIFLTHGHEDHIGGVPYLLKELDADIPIYGTKLTLMLTDNKLQEHRIQNSVQKVVLPGDVIKAGAFEVEFINVNHSISGACALAIRTPHGLVYHSGDFKIDLTPVAGESIDLKRIAELGKEGVLLYMGESTNIERAGYTMSESVVGTTLDHLFSENMDRRLIIATFASNVHRLQQIIDLAVKYRRKVALSGRSMFKVVEAAVAIGELKIPDGVLVDIEKTKNLFDGELLIVSTGSQGEPMSALTRMAMGEFNKVTIGENDTIIISANPIPGNERMIYRVINNLYKQGAHVVYESLEKIHVSGHACQDEHKILHSLLNPKFFIPVHGEYRHLKRHAELAESLGMPEQNILITDIGNCVELTSDSIKFGANVQAGTKLIDGAGVEDYGTSEVMKDRLKMSADGVFTVALAVTGNYVINDPVIEAHGCVFAHGETEAEMLAVVRRAVENYNYEDGNKEELALAIRKNLKNYFYKKTKQAPLIVVSVLDV